MRRKQELFTPPATSQAEGRQAGENVTFLKKWHESFVFRNLFVSLHRTCLHSASFYLLNFPNELRPQTGKRAKESTSGSVRLLGANFTIRCRGCRKPVRDMAEVCAFFRASGQAKNC